MQPLKGTLQLLTTEHGLEDLGFQTKFASKDSFEHIVLEMQSNVLMRPSRFQHSQVRAGTHQVGRFVAVLGSKCSCSSVEAALLLDDWTSYQVLVESSSGALRDL